MATKIHQKITFLFQSEWKANKEIEAKKVTLESRDAGALGQMSQGELVKKFLEEIKKKS